MFPQRVPEAAYFRLRKPPSGSEHHIPTPLSTYPCLTVLSHPGKYNCRYGTLINRSVLLIINTQSISNFYIHKYQRKLVIIDVFD